MLAHPYKSILTSAMYITIGELLGVQKIVPLLYRFSVILRDALEEQNL